MRFTRKKRPKQTRQKSHKPVKGNNRKQSLTIKITGENCEMQREFVNEYPSKINAFIFAFARLGNTKLTITRNA